MDLSARGKIHATGDDRARLLHAMTTQQVEQLTPGEGCYAFFLNAQGRILGDANIFCREGYFLLDTEPETKQKLFEHIDRYIIADDVTLEDSTGRMATVAIEGPEAEMVLEKLSAPVPAPDYGTPTWVERIGARVKSTGASGFSVFLPTEEKAELIAALTAAGGSPTTPAEARPVPVGHLRPRYRHGSPPRYRWPRTWQ